MVICEAQKKKNSVVNITFIYEFFLYTYTGTEKVLRGWNWWSAIPPAFIITCFVKTAPREAVVLWVKLQMFLQFRTILYNSEKNFNNSKKSKFQWFSIRQQINTETSKVGFKQEISPYINLRISKFQQKYSHWVCLYDLRK